MLQRATAADPRNAQARFQLATVLVSLEAPEAALAELAAVRDMAPREANIQFLMGKVCKKLGRLEDAMRHFIIALDLNPKDNSAIKTAVDKLNLADVDERDEI